MALAGCPDSFLHHPYYQDQVEQAPPLSPQDLAGPGFAAPSDRLTHHQEDDVDLEALVNDVNASLESLYPACSMQSETVPLLQNGQHARSQPPPSGTRSLQAQRSQPVHILAVRRLQEEDQQLRTSSLPAIPNPFPELCGPGSPPVLTRGSLPPSQAAAKQDVKIFSEDGTSKVVEIPADMTARDLCQLLVYRSHCVDDNSWTLVEHHPHLGLAFPDLLPESCFWEDGSSRSRGHQHNKKVLSVICLENWLWQVLGACCTAAVWGEQPSRAWAESTILASPCGQQLTHLMGVGCRGDGLRKLECWVYLWAGAQCSHYPHARAVSSVESRRIF